MGRDPALAHHGSIDGGVRQHRGAGPGRRAQFCLLSVRLHCLGVFFRLPDRNLHYVYLKRGHFGKGLLSPPCDAHFHSPVAADLLRGPVLLLPAVSGLLHRDRRKR